MDELNAAYAAQGHWAAQTLSRLLPLLVQKGLMTESSLDTATRELEAARNSGPDEAHYMFDDMLRRLNAEYGSGHFG